MIVAKDEEIVLSLAKAFRNQGWEVVSSSDAIHATNVVLKEKPDAVVLSTTLPGGGINVLKRMRSFVHTAVTPVIAITDQNGPQGKEMIAAGAQEYINRPVDPNAICASVRKLLSLSLVVTEAPTERLRAPQRLAAVLESGMLDTAPTKLFDDITRLAANLLRVPAALISIVAEDRQFFKSQTGLSGEWAESRQTPLSHSFCQWVVSGRDQVAVEDARNHPVLRNNLAVLDYNLIAYAGVPLSGKSDDLIGSVCAIDSNPRAWSESDLQILRDLAAVTKACVALNLKEDDSASSYVTISGGNVKNSAVVRAVAKGIESASRVLRQQWDSINDYERSLLLDILEFQGRRLARISSEPR